jgi:apolipoprotein N-acyltransferase
MYDELYALGIGIALVTILGIYHHYGILAIKRMTPDPDSCPHLSIFVLFPALLALHLTEIALFGAAYWGIATWGVIGDLGANYPREWGDYLYFSGTNFATLGYTALETDGPIRFVAMLQALGGFMVITWSATFIYSLWGDAWREQ